MARNGTGTYIRSIGAYVPGTTISSTEANTEAIDLGNELTNSLPRDGQAAMTGDLPMGANKIKNMANGSLDTDASTVGQMNTAISAGVAGGVVTAVAQAGANAVSQLLTAYTTTGTAPNFVLTPSPALGAYANNQRFRVKFHAAGAGTDQLNISGLGNKALKQYDSTGTKVDCVPASGQLADVEYDGTDFLVIDRLPPTDSNPPGTIVQFSGSSIPTGYLAVPTSVTNVSRTTYAALFSAIGTTWGAGDGSTTFGIPFCPTGYTFAQGTLAVQSTGAVISHSHRWSMTGSAAYSAGGGTAYFPTDRVTGSTIENTELTGGSANLAASVGINYAVKY